MPKAASSAIQHVAVPSPAARPMVLRCKVYYVDYLYIVVSDCKYSCDEVVFCKYGAVIIAVTIFVFFSFFFFTQMLCLCIFFCQVIRSLWTRKAR